MPPLVSNPGAIAPAAPVRGADEIISFTIQPQPGERVQEPCRQLAARLREHAATPLHVLIFGKVEAHAATMDVLHKMFGGVDFPITWVAGAAGGADPIAGIQVHAFTGEVERIVYRGRIVGSVFMEGSARQCLVGGLSPADKTLSRAEQARRTLKDLQTILAQAGLELADTVRTWFYLENILSWYDDFNRARTEFYSGVNFRTGSLPASTGVGAKNSTGTALALAAWAFQPVGRNTYAEEVASPLQCPAPAYGSAFSRAMEISTNTGRRLFISGTASIAPSGETLWHADVHKQVELTMDVVAAMLRSRGFTFADLARATAYFRQPTDAGVFAEWLGVNRLAQMPVISTQCDICRDDLLFEFEAEAELRPQTTRKFERE